MDPKAQAVAAVRILTGLVGGTQANQLDNHTPCSNWTTRDLLNHVTAASNMFASALGGEAVSNPADPDCRAAFKMASAQFSVALAATEGVDQPVTLPFATMPCGAVLQLAAADLLVHSWDLARATGQPFDPPPDLAEAAYGFFKVAISDEWRAVGRFGASFDAHADADPLARLLAHTGRRA